jgi:hypothetical protein
MWESQRSRLSLESNKVVSSLHYTESLSGKAFKNFPKEKRVKS